MAKEIREIIDFQSALAATGGNTEAVGGLMALRASVDHAAKKGWLTPRMPKQGLAIETSTNLLLPEGAIRLPEIITNGMSNEEMRQLADSTRGLNVGSWARDVIKRAPTSSLEEPQAQDLATLDPRTMGLGADYPTTQQIWEKAKKFGDRVSVETMVKLAVEAAKGNIQVEIGKPLVGIMELVTDSNGRPRVLYVRRSEGGLWLDADCADPGNGWRPVDQFVVSPRK